MPGRFFDINEISENKVSTGEESSGAMVIKFLKIHTERIAGLRNLINIPKPEETTIIWTVKSFNAFTFIPFIFQHFGIIEELTISTFSINRRIIDALVLMLDQGRILKVHILISESLKTRLSTVNDHLSAVVVNKPQVTLRYGWNHSKISCIRCGDNFFVAEGSGNWGENAQHENYTFTNSKQVYEFRKEEILAIGSH